MYIQYAPFLAHAGFFYFSTQLSEGTFMAIANLLTSHVG